MQNPSSLSTWCQKFKNLGGEDVDMKQIPKSKQNYTAIQNGTTRIYSGTGDGLDRKCRTLQQTTDLAKGCRVHIWRTIEQGDYQNEGKLSYMLAWTKTKNHLLSQNTEFIGYKEIFRVLKEWCKLKQNEIASFTKLRDLRQGSLSLSEFINAAQLLVQE